MDEYYKLPLNQHEAIYKRLEKEMLENSTASEFPSIVILGGQPGTGKSKLIKFAKELFFSDRKPAIINGDDYRAAHPQSDEIFKADDRQYATRTDSDVRDWTKNLFDSAITSRRDIIFECTMRNKDQIMNTIKKLREEGYQINVLVMAVRGEVSRVSTLVRYEEQKEHKKYGRWTPMESHNEAYMNMPDTVMAIENESPIDSMRIYNRAGDILYENISQGGAYKKPLQTADAKAVIIKEQTRTLTKDEQNALNLQRKTVEEKMFARGASQEEISEIKAILRKDELSEAIRNARESGKLKENSPVVNAMQSGTYEGEIIEKSPHFTIQKYGDMGIVHELEKVPGLGDRDVGENIIIRYKGDKFAEIFEKTVPGEKHIEIDDELEI